MMGRIATVRRNLHYGKPTADNAPKLMYDSEGVLYHSADIKQYLQLWHLGRKNRGCLSIKELTYTV
jgi:hypothetical protein